MDGWIEKHRWITNRWMVRWTEKIYEKIDGWMNRNDRWMVGCIEKNRWMGGRKDKNRWMVGGIDTIDGPLDGQEKIEQ